VRTQVSALWLRLELTELTPHAQQRVEGLFCPILSFRITPVFRDNYHHTPQAKDFKTAAKAQSLVIMHFQRSAADVRH